MNKILTINPIKKINGFIYLPGSKSISNRVLLLSAMTKGKTNLINLLKSDDTEYMINALKVIGVKIVNTINNNYEIISKGVSIFNNIKKNIFLGNAGTAMRSLTASFCLGLNDIILTGENRMKNRPINHLIDSLIQGGASIKYLEKKNFPPLHIKGGYKGGNIYIKGNISSQFLTSLLIISPLVKNDTKIIIKNKIVSKPYIKMTLSLMKIFGICIKFKNNVFFIKGNQKYISPKKYLIEGDASSASYFLAASAVKNFSISLYGINIKNSIQGDSKFIYILKKMGALIYNNKNFIYCKKNKLKGINLDMNNMPDAAMTIAIVSLFAKGATTIYNIYNWRVKETDRLYAMSKELRKIGAIIEEGNNYLRIIPPKIIKSSVIETYNDHRIAMCFSLISLFNKKIKIINPKCVNKTFPKYFIEFAKISNF
ncbi:3-phosphoshikimate 1-carboxyvinyltransferase [Candidatus Annandia adelgestsuga]|uniref:3-phosphoshikimate 1-carboxyvinyltransferase n=1 Tax=Candidatus Annandia adelgestsuga TaxID=1302411 RepID=A0A3S9J7B3_9ENTR|nr:3-phosphoshikimate 1-carboxyvinyltransferase [Candidatus Annandia adelgestsuga]AZP36164.1 3-phosphoshikimate 1-carboxyvinyltransferase [Candidatus Annandia adelgestsuga]